MSFPQAGMNGAIRLVALFEGLKGLVVLLAGTGLLGLVHRDAHALALSLVAHAHLNPAGRYPQIFLEAASHLHESRLLLLAAGALLYALLRFVEAFGLYRQRAWAELLAAVSGAVYLPFEAFAFARDPTALHAGLLLANAAVVAVMVLAYRRRRRGIAGPT
jgi:uncharacterized membrane protein (DUF2068 family)